ncbi:MAG: NUDIX domain-containing protein [Chthonomonadales bacterium]
MFPVVEWSDLGVTATFDAQGERAGEAAAAVVVFARHSEGFVLAEIPGRGWCTPSGHINPGETDLDAARRETREEIGAELEDLRPIGHFILQDGSGGRSDAPAFVGRVSAFGHLPPGSEARGVRVVALCDLPRVYYRWDELLERVFAFAEQCLAAAP